MTAQSPSPTPRGLLYRASGLFDFLDRIWHAESTRRRLSLGFIVAFLGSIGLIELARQGVVTELLGHRLPTNHFRAVSWIVTLLLVIEVLDLIFGLAASVARTIGMQLEIFSLVLLRKTFDKLPEFPEPVVVEGHMDAIYAMGSQAGGALVVFLILAGFYRIQRHTPVSDNPDDVAYFIATKKLICLFLLVAFLSTGSISAFRSVVADEPEGLLSLHFFEAFYTLLIFTDVLVVLASLGATRLYRVIFRNFAFAFVTVMLRLALAAEPHTNAILGVSAALYALAVSGVVWCIGEGRRSEVEIETPSA